MRPEDITESPRLGGCVVRYHTWPTLTQQTVADHTFHVLRIFMEMFGVDRLRSAVTVSIILHDITEVSTGDPPFPVKAVNGTLGDIYRELEADALRRMYPGLRSPSITSEEKKMIKIADLVEMAEFGTHEQHLGNSYAAPIVERTRAMALTVAARLESVSDRQAACDYIERRVQCQ